MAQAEDVAAGRSELQWQDDYTGPGYEPLKGKEFNDRIIEKTSAGDIISIIDESMLEFSVVNAVTALHRIAKTPDAMEWRRDPRIKYLNRRIVKMFQSAKRDEVEKLETGRRVPGAEWVYYIDTRSLCNAAWAVAHLALRDDELMEAISEETCKKIFDSNAQQIAILSWSMAKMQRTDLPLMQTLADETVRRIMEFNSQHLMNFVWGCAKLKFLHIEVMMAIASAAMQDLEDFTPQHLSITVWAFATLGFRHEKLMTAVADEVLRTLRAFRPQNIANTAWAYATLDFRHDALMDALALAAIPKLRDYSQQNLANLVWAFSTLRLYHEGLFEAAAQQVIARALELDSQGLSMAASAFANLGVLHRPMFDAISRAAVRSIDSFSPRDLENIVCSFATVGLCVPELFDAVADRAMRSLHRFTSLDLATISWSFATVGRLHEPLMRAVADRAVSVIAEGSFPSQALAKIAWGFRTLGVEHAALLKAVSDECIRKLERHDLEHLVTLVDCDLPCMSQLAHRLGVVLYHFSRALPTTWEGWRSEDYPVLLAGLKVDHFGREGTAFLLGKMGIFETSEEFQDWASRALADHLRQGAQSEAELSRAGYAQSRHGALLEYTLTVPGSSVPLSGTLVREHAVPPPQGKPTWLHAAGSLKVGPHASRALRGEFLALEELCCIALGGRWASAGRRVSGTLRMFSSTYPCVSCVGAMVQTQQLLPGIRVEASNGALRGGYEVAS